MKRKGFTTIELLAVIVLLAVIMGIAVVGIKYLLDKGSLTFYENIEQELVLSGNDYFNNHRNLKPIEGTNNIDIKTLVDAGYIDPVVDKDGNLCTEGKVYIYLDENNEYQYKTCLVNCGGYTTNSCDNIEDEEPPTCTILLDGEQIIIGKTKVNYTITCTDNKGFSDSSISTSDISLSNKNVVILDPIRKTSANENGTEYVYTGAIAGNSVGETTFILNRGAVSDGAGNKNKEMPSGKTLRVYNEAIEGTIHNNLTYNGEEQVLIEGGSNVTYSITKGKNPDTYEIIITANDNSLFSDGKKTHEVYVTIGKGICTCNISNIPAMSYPGNSVDVSYSCNGDGTKSITSSDTNSISVSGSTLTPKKVASNITITANQSAGTYYNACTAGTKTVNVGSSTYNISYELNGGTNYSGAPTSYTYGSGATLNGTPTKSGNTFNGWCTGLNLTGCAFSQSISGTTSGAKTYYAKWCQNCASVSNGKCTLTATTAGTCTYTTSCNTGYTLKSGSGTYNPTCSINTYTLTVNAGDGTIPATSGWTIASGSKTATKGVNYGAQYGTLPTPTRTNYRFDGWFTAASGGSAVSASTTIGAGNATIYAHWTQLYTVTFDTQGAKTAGTTTQQIVAGSTATPGSITIPTKDGNEFRGYFTAEGGQGTQMIASTGNWMSDYSSHVITSNVTLYARWRFTVTFDNQGATKAGTQSVQLIYKSPDNPTSINIPTKKGYIFKGYWTAKSGGTKIIKNSGEWMNGYPGNLTENITLYARWASDSGCASGETLKYMAQATCSGGNTTSTHYYPTASYTAESDAKAKCESLRNNYANSCNASLRGNFSCNVIKICE